MGWPPDAAGSRRLPEGRWACCRAKSGDSQANFWKFWKQVAATLDGALASLAGGAGRSLLGLVFGWGLVKGLRAL